MVETIQIPAQLVKFELPEAVKARLQYLLDKQDEGDALSSPEKQEAEGFVDLTEFMSLLKLRAQTSQIDR